ncbi:FG-GAP repeat protein, partial [Ralstonia sp. VS2407]
VYAYTKFNTPIALHGVLKQGTCRLVESNTRGKATAALTIPNFTTAKQTVVGTWKNLATGQQLPLTLTRLENDQSAQDTKAPHELLQVASLPNGYFKVVLTGNPDALGSQLTAVRLFDKKTNRLVQEVPVDCQSHGLHSVSVGDFNFDGYLDFSVFESSYAGPNTSSLYFLFTPAT